MQVCNADLLLRDLLDADSSESEVEWCSPAFNVAGELLVSDVMVHFSRVEDDIKCDLEKNSEVTCVCSYVT